MIFITSRLPFPAVSGRKNVMFNYCKILNENFGYKIKVIAFLEKGDDPTLKPNFIDEVIVIPNIKFLCKLVNLIIYTFILRKFPMQVSLFYSKKIKKEIHDIILKSKPQYVMTDMIRTTEYIKDLDVYKIADLDDLISIRYSRQLKHDMNNINPYGAYLYQLPRSFQKLLSISKIKKKVLETEIELLKKYEIDIAGHYEKVILVSENEASILNDKTHLSNAVSVPLGVEFEYFSKYTLTSKKKKFRIGFLGAMNVAHNETGIIHFINDILPIIKQKIPEAELIIVGGGVTEKLLKLKSDSIYFTGKVPDVREILSECEVFVCPLVFGSGIKTKILEAMAMGIPVVTTSVGAENINAINGKDWIIADDDNQFAEMVLKIMMDEDLYSNLRKNGSDFVRNNFTWNVAIDKFHDVFNN